MNKKEDEIYPRHGAAQYIAIFRMTNHRGFQAPGMYDLNVEINLQDLRKRKQYGPNNKRQQEPVQHTALMHHHDNNERQDPIHKCPQVLGHRGGGNACNEYRIYCGKARQARQQQQRPHKRL